MKPSSSEAESELSRMKESFNEYSKYTTSMLSLGIGGILHPLSCAKILIQLGHEPLALERGKSYLLFGSDSYFLPNAFKYIRYLKQKDGCSGIYTGLGSAMCCNIFGLGASTMTLDHLNKKFPDEILSKAMLKAETSGKAYSRFVRKLSKLTASKAIGIIVARPFQVIVIRRVAQLVGGETIYITTFGSLKIIYGEEGIRGLFSGLIPQLVGELMILWVSSTMLFAFDRYWTQCVANQNEEELDDDDADSQITTKVKNSWKTLIQHIIPYFVNGVFYPFSLISTLIAANGTQLKVGRWPHIPIFLHWQDCWDYLAKENHLKRGSKLFMRTYVGPVDFKEGHIYVRGPKKVV